MTTALYRDPIFDGATDPLVVIDRGRWWMFYTQRRANHPDPGPGVSWVHGSRIGVACSTDGATWEYQGTLTPTDSGLTLTPGAPPLVTTMTHWAPEVVRDRDRWRMYLTEIDGVPREWAGHARRIVEYESTDLANWKLSGPIALPSDRAIDAAVHQCPDGLWRLWYKDEASGSLTRVSSSPDLNEWTDEGIAIGGRAHEGPSVFALGGYWWMIVDEWRGMGVYRSSDARAWKRQGDADTVLLAGDHRGAGRAHHGAAATATGTTWFYYFTHPGASAWTDASAENPQERLSTVHRVQLCVVDGELTIS